MERKYAGLWEYFHRIAYDFQATNGQWSENPDNMQIVYSYYKDFYNNTFPKIHVNPEECYTGKKAYILSIIHGKQNAPTNFMREFVKRYSNKDIIVISVEEFGKSDLWGGEIIRELSQRGYKVYYLKGDEHKKVQDCCNTLAEEKIETAIYATSLACPISWLIAQSRPCKIQINTHRGLPMICDEIDIYTYFHEYGEKVQYANMRKKGHKIYSVYLGHGIEDKRLPRILSNQVRLLSCSNHLSGRMTPEFCNNMKELLSAYKPEEVVWYIVGRNEDCHYQKQILEKIPNAVWIGKQENASMTFAVSNIYADTYPGGSGRAVLEAMRAGLAVCSGNGSGLHVNTVSAAYSGLGLSPEKYIKRLKRLIDNPDECEKEGDAMRKRFINNYELSIYIDRFNDMLNQYRNEQNEISL